MKKEKDTDGCLLELTVLARTSD
ncbi:hypothetical protein ALC57_13089 [Trachymyrmex cornetzi]|uniref:Uncharacterized protein n=1 Tax=Trachymyrmex cornetzi TaxID=471704 RepID=A0A195DP34_9HYME|nr:hypothetical protein ALC57_13089 [Trachymyrmex cornetzi]